MTRQDELRKMVAEATPGPWWSDESDPSDVVVWGKADELVANLGHRVQPVLVAFDVDASNGYLIAQAPTLATDLAAALDKIERLEAALSSDVGPALGAQSREPSLRSILFHHYKNWMLTEDARFVAERYIAALATGEG